MEADDSVPADESTFSESHAYDSKARSRSKQPHGGGREKIATPIKKERRKKYEQTRSSDRKSIRLRKETFNRLLAFKHLHRHKDWESTIQDLLKIYPPWRNFFFFF
jgi:hypothetical protein